MVQPARIVVQAEQERPDQLARSVLVPTESGDDAIGGARVLDLEHRPLARLIGAAGWLGDDAVQTGTFELGQPSGGQLPVSRAGGQVQGCFGLGQQALERRPPLDLRTRAQVLAFGRQRVEGHE